MLINTIDNDIGFDSEKAIKIAKHYSIACGINCFIIDSKGKTIYNSYNKNTCCKFCEKMQKILNQKLSCSKAHLYGSYQAERFGGKYIFFCPVGLVHWASPISTQGMMKGAVLGGPVLMVEHEEFLMDDIVRKYNIDSKQTKELRKYIKQIPFVEPEQVSSLSEILFISSLYISDDKDSQYIIEGQSLQQQSNISEYIQYIKTMGEDIKNISNYPIEKERQLLSYISMGNKAGSQKILNEILGHVFFSSGRKFEIVKARTLELVVLLSRAALEGGADVEQIFGLNYKYLSQINDFHSVEDLAFWLSKIMSRFTDCVFNLTDVKHVDVIYKAIDYIKRNYMKKISLDDVANNVYLSSSYFSKIFKDEMKCNFNTYLNKIRIEASKKILLSNDSISLVDVANLVGYEDQSYFSKVFKKIVKMSPGKYRESRGQYKKA